MSDLDVLWQPLRVGSTTVPNRVVFSAHGVGLAGERYADYLAERARGGAGLLITGAAAVDPASDAGLLWNLWQPESVADVRLAADAVHREGRPLIVQLSHVGAQFPGPRTTDEWGRLFAPSAIPSPLFGVVPKAMEEEDIARLIEGYVVSARHVREAGVDGVEIHAAHGNLLNTFFSPLTNIRTDDYGGDVARRARLALDIATAIRRECGSDFTVGLKICYDEFVEGGITPELASETLRVLHAGDLFNFFSIACGSGPAFHHVVVPFSSGLSKHTVAYAQRAREIVGESVPVIATGTVRTIEDAAEIVRNGRADLVGMIRAQLADPEVVRKAQEGRSREIRRCVGANQGCWRRMAREGLVVCTVNPTTGREAAWGTASDTKTRDPRRVLIVGGGPAGMKLAETAAASGHQVTLAEREAELGGQVRFAGMLPYRESWHHLLDDLSSSLDRLGVDVRLETEMQAEDVLAHRADVTFIATGSVWDLSGSSIHRPGSAGFVRSDSSHVVSPVTAAADPASCGELVTIVDDHGGYLPLGLAEHLVRAGRRVTIVTSASAVGEKLGVLGTSDFGWVYPRIVDAGVSIITSTYVDRVEPGSVTLVERYGAGAVTLECHTVVPVMLRISDDSLYGELCRRGIKTRRIGDCLAPREIDDALFEGTREGYAINNRHTSQLASVP